MFEVILVPAEKLEIRERQVCQAATTTGWTLVMIRTTTAKDRVVSTADQFRETNQSSYNKTRCTAEPDCSPYANPH